MSQDQIPNGATDSPFAEILMDRASLADQASRTSEETLLFPTCLDITWSSKMDDSHLAQRQFGCKAWSMYIRLPSRTRIVMITVNFFPCNSEIMVCF